MPNEAVPQGNRDENTDQNKMNRRKMILQGGAVLGGVAAVGIGKPWFDYLTGEKPLSQEQQRELTEFGKKIQKRVQQIGSERKSTRADHVMYNLWQKTKGDSVKVDDKMIVDEFEALDRK